MSSIKGTFKIKFENGVVQHKILIDQTIYVEHQTQVAEALLNGGGEKSIQKLKKEFKKLYGDEFFTTLSPMGLAIDTGYMSLPETQGGKIKCKIIPID